MSGIRLILSQSPVKTLRRDCDQAGLCFMQAHQQARLKAEIVSSCWPDAALNVLRPEAV